MPVTLSRFVNVMSGGTLAKDWWEKPLHKQDAKIAALLKTLSARLDCADNIGLKKNPDLKKLKDEYEDMAKQYYSAGGGKSPAKFLEAEERVRKNAGKAIEKIDKLLAANEKAAMEYALGPEEFKARYEATADQIQNSGARVDGLSPTEMVAIRTYTLYTPFEDTSKTPLANADFVDMNRLFRNEARVRSNSTDPLEVIAGDPAKIKAKMALLEKAMSKLPNYTATQPTQRLDIYWFAVGKDAAKWPSWPGIYGGFNVGSDWVVPAFWSTGKTGTINSSADQVIIWTVYGSAGKDIDALSALKGEGGGEVLYPPRTKFKVEAMSIDPPDPDSANKKTWRVTVREAV